MGPEESRGWLGITDLAVAKVGSDGRVVLRVPPVRTGETGGIQLFNILLLYTTRKGSIQRLGAVGLGSLSNRYKSSVISYRRVRVMRLVKCAPRPPRRAAPAAAPRWWSPPAPVRSTCRAPPIPRAVTRALTSTLPSVTYAIWSAHWYIHIMSIGPPYFQCRIPQTTAEYHKRTLRRP